MAQNLNEHRTGILGKTVPVDNMLTWTKVPLASVFLLFNEAIASGAVFIIVPGRWAGGRKRFWSQLNSKTVRDRPYLSLGSY